MRINCSNTKFLDTSAMSPKMTSSQLREIADSSSEYPRRSSRLTAKRPNEEGEAPKDNVSPQKKSSKTDSVSKTGAPDVNRLKIEDVVGDIFDAPDNTVLIHACNCQGAWGSGIAAAFKQKYPKAFKRYNEHCTGKTVPTGTALLIPPVEDNGPKHFIGCLFTSSHWGQRKDSPRKIRENTGPAMKQLLQQLRDLKSGDHITEIRICQINSGAFKVPWKHSLEILKNLELEEGMPDQLIVYSRE